MYDGHEASTTVQAPIPQLRGIITSPNFPDNYPPDFEKTFTIKGTPGNILQFIFVDFDIDKSYIFYDYESYDYDSQTYDWDYDRPSCPNDWIQVTVTSYSDISLFNNSVI